MAKCQKVKKMINIPNTNYNSEPNKNPQHNELDIDLLLDKIYELENQNTALLQINSEQERTIRELQASKSNGTAESHDQSLTELKSNEQFLLDEIKTAHHGFVLLSNRLRRSICRLEAFSEDYPFLDPVIKNLTETIKLAENYREQFAIHPEQVRKPAGNAEKNRTKKKNEAGNLHSNQEEADNKKIEGSSQLQQADYEKVMQSFEILQEELENPEVDQAKIDRSVEMLQHNLEQAAIGNQKLFVAKNKAEAQARRNNKNSHIPSGQLPKFLVVPHTTHPTGNPVGGVAGHTGHSLVIDENQVDKIIKLYPEGFNRNSTNLIEGEKRYVINEYTIVEIVCYEQMIAVEKEEDGKEKKIKAKFPPGVTGYLQYGDTVTTDATALNIIGMMSKNKIAQYLKERLEVPITAATIVKMIKKAASKVEPVEEELRKRLKNSQIVHFDETPVKVGKKQVYVHTATNENYTLLKRGRNRGELGAEDLGVADGFKGVSVSDRFSLYTGKLFANIDKAFCHDHFRRDLTAIQERHPNMKWPTELINVFQEMQHYAKLAREKDLDRVPPDIYEKEMEKFFHALELAHFETKDLKPEGRDNTKSVITALDKYWVEFCRFFDDLRVPYTNNLAEQSLRCLKLTGKVSGPHRSAAGLDEELILRSYCQTAQKQGLNPIVALSQAILGNPQYIFTHKKVETTATAVPKLKVIADGMQKENYK